MERAVKLFGFILTDNEIISDQRATAMSLIIVLTSFYWLASNVFIQLSAQIYSSFCMFSQFIVTLDFQEASLMSASFCLLFLSLSVFYLEKQKIAECK